MNNHKSHRLFVNIFIILAFYSLNTWSQHKNIIISGKNNPQEATICINTKNPNFIVAAANTENYYYSSDTGKTWRNGYLKSHFGVAGDPCIIFDSLGNFYYFHLSKSNELYNPQDRIVFQKSYNNGASWSRGTYLGLNGNYTQDKEWAAIDTKSDFIYVLWTEIKKNYTGEKLYSSNINVSVSKDHGEKWSEPIRINEKSGNYTFNDENIVLGAMPAIGPNGEVYATWVNSEGIYFDKSLDSGKTWMSKDIKLCPLNTGLLKIPGIYRHYIFPIIACDAGTSQYKGSIYITWANQKNGKNNTDIWLSKSIDNGQTWTNPTRINNDSTSRHQYFPWIAIDQTNGKVYIVFYDRRSYDDNKTDVYLAMSEDGGETFKNFKISERAFTPSSLYFTGDYIGIAAYNNIIRPVWTVMDDKLLSIWTALINVDLIK